MLKGFDRPREVPRRPGTQQESRQPVAGHLHTSTRTTTGSNSRKLRVPASVHPARGGKIPYLNVITNFSKPSTTSTIAAPAPSHQRDPSLQDRRRVRLNGGSRDRIEQLKARDPDWGLSPSDRDLVIGMSIPGPPAGRSEQRNLSIEGQLEKYSPKPAIVITPAATRPAIPKGRSRVPSSIYSRHPNGNKSPGSAPPLPRNPAHSFATSIETSSRCTSWATDFSEDDTLQHSRPESRESQRPIYNRRSTDTIATKYRSRGWWNQILSPFLERPEYTRDVVPDSANTASTEGFRSENWKLYKDKTEDQSPADSIWADLTGHYTQKTGTFFTESKDLNFNNYPGVHRGDVVESPAALEASRSLNEDAVPNKRGTENLETNGSLPTGLAAEYYEAYWHDQNNPAPFFKCENHACVKTLGSLGGKLESAAREGSRVIEDHARRNEQEVERERFIEESVDSGKSKTPLEDASTAVKYDFDPKPKPRSRNLPITALARSRERPLPAAPVDPISPEAMTPGLRAAFQEDRAVPLRSNPTKWPLEETKAPRYPSPAFVTPLPAEQDRSRGVTAAAPTKQPASASKPAPNVWQSSKTNGMERGPPQEINDSHVWKFPPPPGDAAAKKSKSRGANSKDEESKVGFFKRMFGKNKSKERKKRRRLFCCIFFALLLMVILIVVLVIELTLPRNDMPTQISWLNVTGFPPAPTGISTIIRPSIESANGCVAPPTMWSCALPKELQSTITPNPADQPNFRVEIRFQNGSNLTTNNGNSKRDMYSDDNEVSLSRLFRRRLLAARDSFTSGLFTPSPAPPSTEDQDFLGNTTDHNHAPFGGEVTPFFMSILNANPISNPTRRLLRRQSSSSGNSTNSTDPFPDLSNDIPAPAINSDGTAAPANLYPLPSAQPLMLYDRGLETEHYGFYTYFDRSIFLKSASVANLSTIGVVPDDENGGSTENEASLRCTWAQTRFLVQIWTNAQGNLPLISNGTKSSGNGGSSSNSSSNSANDFTPPGSFPYPISITMDRHGGDINLKSIYCYGMDDREHIISTQKQFQLENRAFGGHLINSALGLFDHINVSLADGGPGGIDGGSGGCSCLWRNFDSA